MASESGQEEEEGLRGKNVSAHVLSFFSILSVDFFVRFETYECKANERIWIGYANQHEWKMFRFSDYVF